MDENNKPISRDKGKCYRRWVDSVKECGYKYDYRILNSADFGAYTARKRFFGIFAKAELPIVFPTPTHSKSGVNDMFGTFDKWKAVKDVLDFDDQGNSIFSRKKPLSEKTMERIYAGLIKFVAGGKDKWMLKYNSTSKKGKHNPPGVDEPCPTVACQNRLGIAGVTFLSKYYSGHPESKNIPIDAPAHTIKCKDNHSLIQPKFLSAYYGNGHNHSVDSPAPTVTTRDRLAYINPSFLDMQYGNGTPASCDAPAPVVTTNPKHNLVNCYLMNPQFKSKGGDVDKPCFTLIARMDKMPPYLVSTVDGGVGIEVYDTDSPCTVKIKEFMAVYGIMDIMMRMLKIPELKQIMGFPKDYVLVGTQADQKKFIGNAVEVTMARVLCEALSKEITELEVKKAA
jgi:DNA (cytosine-5)-methyltransferase 1